MSRPKIHTTSATRIALRVFRFILELYHQTKSAIDAVDGSSTGTWVPRMWVLRIGNPFQLSGDAILDWRMVPTSHLMTSSRYAV
jgi:hypothetical protein